MNKYNIIERITMIEMAQDKPNAEIQNIKNRIERLEGIIESMGYYISGK